MTLVEWVARLPEDTPADDWLSFSESGMGPDYEYQPHYSVEVAAQVLKLNPITVRQYVREGRIRGRRVGRNWMVSADSLGRYIYNSTHDVKALESIPIGIAIIWADSYGSKVLDYRFVSNHEIEGMHGCGESIYQLMGVEPGGTTWPELWAVLTFQDRYDLFEMLGLYSPSMVDLRRGGNTLGDQRLELRVPVIQQMSALAQREWYNLPLPMIEESYRNWFGAPPTASELRLLRVVLEHLTQGSGDEVLIAKMKRNLGWITDALPEDSRHLRIRNR